MGLMLFRGRNDNVPTEHPQGDSLYLWDKKNVVGGERQRQTHQPKRDEKAATVFLKIQSEVFFLVSPVKGQEVNLSSLSLGAGVFAFCQHKESPRGDYYHILITSNSCWLLEEQEPPRMARNKTITGGNVRRLDEKIKMTSTPLSAKVRENAEMVPCYSYSKCVPHILGSSDCFLK